MTTPPPPMPQPPGRRPPSPTDPDPAARPAALPDARPGRPVVPRRPADARAAVAGRRPLPVGRRGSPTAATPGRALGRPAWPDEPPGDLRRARPAARRCGRRRRGRRRPRRAAGRPRRPQARAAVAAGAGHGRDRRRRRRRRDRAHRRPSSPRPASSRTTFDEVRRRSWPSCAVARPPTAAAGRRSRCAGAAGRPGRRRPGDRRDHAGRRRRGPAAGARAHHRRRPGRLPDARAPRWPPRSTRWSACSAPRSFRAVGQAYGDFAATTDDEVRAALAAPPRRTVTRIAPGGVLSPCSHPA